MEHYSNYDGIGFIINDKSVRFDACPAAGTITLDHTVEDADLYVLSRIYRTIFALGERRAQARIAEKVEDLMDAFGVTFKRGV